jgi:5,10-methylenetetrahydromethanopterin reductase
MRLPKFGLNRHDTSSVAAYAADVTRAEYSGWDAAFLPDSQLRRRDTYVLLAAAAQATSEITIGPLLTNPITRHPSVTASSIATIAELAQGRTILGLGVGDTAVRLAGLRPARVSSLEVSTRLIQSLLAGEKVDVNARRPAFLPFAQPVPIWIAAGGPRTLRMAGSVADGVFIRVGTDIRNIASAVKEIRAGAEEAGRDPKEIRLGTVLHTVFHDDLEESLLMGKSMAAGYYEYSPTLFNNVGLDWTADSPDELKSRQGIWPDFHHNTDLLESGRVVDFLSEAHARAFSLLGDAQSITAQLLDLLTELYNLDIEFEYVVLHPIPNPPTPDYGPDAYLERVPSEILPIVRDSLAGV